MKPSKPTAKSRTSTASKAGGATAARKSSAATSPASRRSTPATAAADWRSEMLDRVRSLIKQADPKAVEEIKWRKPSNNMQGVPVWSHDGIICTGETYKDKVKLTFARGAELPAAVGLFNASLDGNARRAIDLHEGDSLNAKAFKELIRAAVALNSSTSGSSRTVRAAKKSPTTAARPSAAAAQTTIHADIIAYNTSQSPADKRICDLLADTIQNNLPNAENKIWHRHPVWFLDGNPIVGYSKLKESVRLLFWSGQSFDEPGLAPEGSFKAADARFTSDDQISVKDLKRWLKKSAAIQWDYKNIVKRKGRLDRLK